VEKQQDIAAAGACAGVHLRCPAARRGDDAVGKSACALWGAILAAAVNHQELDADTAQRLQAVQQITDARRFVEHRNDDRQACHLPDQSCSTRASRPQA
jgi:hypothetical protein